MRLLLWRRPAMAFAQLTYRESLRGIETCFHSMRGKLYQMGLRTAVARSTLADANENRDWRIFAGFAQASIRIARPLHADDPLGVELEHALCALAATMFDLRFSLFPWARFRQNHAAIKVHTLLEPRGKVPTFLHVSERKRHDVNVLDEMAPEAGAFYVMDRAHLDFDTLCLSRASAGRKRQIVSIDCFTGASSTSETKGDLQSHGPAHLETGESHVP